ncbi:MAG: oligosaccharide flippase family protein, partial [Aeriscardovia sp.]|nr:oligosaccharide flippase family protein [Aeriscardovia sp.]
QVVIGKCYSPATLGQYTRGKMFSDMLSSNLTGVVQRVSFPVLSQIQDDPIRLKDGYRRIIRSTMLVTFCATLMLAAIAKPMILVLIGEKWLQAATLLQILCFGSMLYPLHAINLNILQVKGRSDLFLKLEIIKKIIAVGPLLLGIFISIYWMLIGSVFTGIICYYLNAYYSGPLLGYSMRAQIKDITPSFLIGITGAAAAFLPSLLYDCVWQGTSWSSAAFVIFPLQLALGGGVILMLCERKRPSEYIELKGITLNTFSKFRQ